MGRLSHLAMILALVLSMLAPTMACALPNAQMTAQEKACCRMMKGHCGSMHMPASHGCCQKSMQANHLDAVQPQSISVQTIAVGAVLPSLTIFNHRVSVLERISPQQPSPPISPPSTVSVLRI